MKPSPKPVPAAEKWKLNVAVLVAFVFLALIVLVMVPPTAEASTPPPVPPGIDDAGTTVTQPNSQFGPDLIRLYVNRTAINDGDPAGGNLTESDFSLSGHQAISLVDGVYKLGCNTVTLACSESTGVSHTQPGSDNVWKVKTNISFPTPKTITKFFGVASCGGASAADAEFWFLNSTGGLIAKTNSLSSCVATTFWLNTTIYDVSNISFVTKKNAAGGVTIGHYEWHAWDSTNATNYPMWLAYGDYLAATANFETWDSATVAAGVTFTTETFQVPPGTGFYYAAVLYQSNPSMARASVTQGCSGGDGLQCNQYNILAPTPNSTDVTFGFLGVTINYGATGKIFSVWSYNNTANSAKTATLSNVTTVNLNGTFTLFPEWMFQVGSMFSHTHCITYDATASQGCPIKSDTTTIPFGNATCPNFRCTTTSDSKQMLGFGYKNLTGPFSTITFGSIGWGDGEDVIMDFRNIFTVEQNALDGVDSFTIDLGGARTSATVGNAIYMSLWAPGPTSTICQDNPPDLTPKTFPGGFMNPLNWFEFSIKLIYSALTDAHVISCELVGGNNNICNPQNGTITVNGVETELAINTFTFERSRATGQFPDGQLTLGCMWILDDTQRSNNVPRVQGQNTMFDNQLGNTGVYAITLPPNLVRNDWRSIQTIAGNHSARTVCHQDLFVCFANANTVGWPVGSFVPVATYNFHVLDIDTNASLPNVSIFEVVTSNLALTNAQGDASFTLPVTAPVFEFSKDGYNTLVQGFNRAVEGQINNMTIRMSRDPNKQFLSASCSPTTVGLSCDLNATSDVGQSCEEINLGFGGCLRGPIFGTGLKIVQFVCPADASQGFNKPLSNVTAREINSAFSLTMVVNEEQAYTPDCFGGETTLIQSSNQHWTFSKIGYRTIDFDADWLTNTVIRFAVIMKQGTGNAAYSMTVQNTTILHGGIAKPGTFIILTDTGQADSTIADLGQPGSIPNSIVDLGAGIGFIGADGEFWWGLLLWVLFTAGILYLWASVKARASHGTTGEGIGTQAVAIAATPSYAAVAMLGLWPDWFILGTMLLVGAVFFIAWPRRGGGSGGEE